MFAVQEEIRKTRGTRMAHVDPCLSGSLVFGTWTDWGRKFSQVRGAVAFMRTMVQTNCEVEGSCAEAYQDEDGDV